MDERAMDTVERSRRAAIAAARDAAEKARVLAESLEVLARAPDTMAVQVPPPGWRDVGVGEPIAKDEELWTATEVALFAYIARHLTRGLQDLWLLALTLRN
jgi:hypothetical protein